MTRSNVLTNAFHPKYAGALNLPTAPALTIAGATGAAGQSPTASSDTGDRWHITCKAQANIFVGVD
jgi:hypothetical protein